jgi:hypothetical protein
MHPTIENEIGRSLREAEVLHVAVKRIKALAKKYPDLQRRVFQGVTQGYLSEKARVECTEFEINSSGDLSCWVVGDKQELSPCRRVCAGFPNHYSPGVADTPDPLNPVMSVGEECSDCSGYAGDETLSHFIAPDDLYERLRVLSFNLALCERICTEYRRLQCSHSKIKQKSKELEGEVAELREKLARYEQAAP